MKQIAIANPFTGITVPSSGGSINVNSTTGGQIVSAILPYIFSAAALLLLIYLILGGLQLMTSRGDPKAVQTAQAKITTSLIGFTVILLAYAIVKLLGQIFGITVFGALFG